MALQIGNDKGSVNGWIGCENVFAKAISVADPCKMYPQIERLPKGLTRLRPISSRGRGWALLDS